MSTPPELGHYLSEGDDSKSDISFEKLKKWNMWAGILHAVQATLMLVAALAVENISNFKLQLTFSFLSFNETDKTLYPDMRDAGKVPIGPIVSVFLYLSAIMHFFVISPLYFETYCANIRKGINKARWYEYAVSSSLMIVLIAMLFGCLDIASLLLIIACNASMNLFGLMMEVLNQYTDEVDWSPFWFGTFAGAAPWIVVFMYFFGSGEYAQIPGFVYGILAAYAIFFNTFPINMVLQYKKVGKFADYRYGELGYIVLSLVSKSLLAWIVFGGTQQPQ